MVRAMTAAACQRRENMRASTQRHVQKHPKNGNHQYHASALRKSRKKNPQVAGLAIADGLETGTPDIPTVFMLCPAIEKTVLMFSNLLGIPSVAAALNWLMAIAVMTCHSSLRMIWLLPSQDFSSCSTKSFPENSIETEEPRSEEHTSELQSPCNLVCRLLL